MADVKPIFTKAAPAAPVTQALLPIIGQPAGSGDFPVASP